MRKKIGWAVVGMGLQGQRLVRAVEDSSHAELVATASEREAGSFERMLGNPEVDAVVIATPNDRHAEQIVAAARAGKHILCEKPLTLTLAEARIARQAVRKAGVRCFVNYHLRAHPEVQKLRARIREKKLGELTAIEMQWSIGSLAGKRSPLPRHMRWREDPRQSGGGALMARGVHLFDLLRFLTGKEVTELRAWSDATGKAVDRTAISLCTLEKNVPALITTSKVMPEADNHIVLYGSKGKAVVKDVFTADPQDMYEQVFGYFYDAVRGKQTPLATLEDGIAVVGMVEAFNQSVRQKKAVRL